MITIINISFPLLEILGTNNTINWFGFVITKHIIHKTHIKNNKIVITLVMYVAL